MGDRGGGTTDGPTDGRGPCWSPLLEKNLGRNVWLARARTTMVSRSKQSFSLPCVWASGSKQGTGEFSRKGQEKSERHGGGGPATGKEAGDGRRESHGSCAADDDADDDDCLAAESTAHWRLYCRRGRTNSWAWSTSTAWAVCVLWRYPAHWRCLAFWWDVHSRRSPGPPGGRRWPGTRRRRRRQSDAHSPVRSI